MAFFSKSKHFTLMIIPDEAQDIKKIVIPAWIMRGGMVTLGLVTLVAIILGANYWMLLSQVGENKDLRIDNRRLRAQVDLFESKLSTVEASLDRIRTFATRLKTITNIEESGVVVSQIHDPLPEANQNIPKTAIPLSPEDKYIEAQIDDLNHRILSIDSSSLYIEELLQDQYELLQDQKAFLAALPTRKPVLGGEFTSGFGVRKSPFGGRIRMHEGLDIANSPGTPIVATADGTVSYADGKPGYGMTVVIDHGYGLETWYGHNRKLSVKRGQTVKRGQVIAELGNTGRSTGPHVHYEVRARGIPVDPLNYLLESD